MATFVSFAQDVNCTLCVDPLATPNDPSARVNTGTETLTCQDLYDRGTFLLPEENCTALQDIGRDLCLCESDAPTLNNCTLCEDGSALGQPLLEGRSGDTCAELQVDAQRDDEVNCYAWQGTVGVYCGCENNVVSQVLACRLCGNDTQLPNPLDTQEEGGSSCGKLEFEASLPGANCSEYQEGYGEYCCRNVPPPPTPTSSGLTIHRDGVVFVLSFLTVIRFLMAV